MTNPFEQKARMVKVQKMLSTAVALVGGQSFPARAAWMFAQWPKARREALAYQAGINPPSQTTWIMFLREVSNLGKVAA